MTKQLYFDAKDTWMTEAACSGEELRIFFPSRGESTTEAKAICSGCSVVEECFQYWTKMPGVSSGIWGGTSELQRKRKRGRSIQNAYELEHGLAYIYHRGILSRVVRATPEILAMFVEQGYKKLEKSRRG